MNVRMMVNEISEGLYCTEHRGHTTVAVNLQRVNITDGLPCCTTEFSEQFAIIAEVDA